MKKQANIIAYAVSMILKSVVLAAVWAGKTRKHGLESISKMPVSEKDKEPVSEKDKEIHFLRNRIHQLETRIKIFQKQYHSSSSKLRYDLKERLFILWHMEYFQIPRRRVTKTFGIARSTLYRWLKRIDGRTDSVRQPWNRTSEHLFPLIPFESSFLEIFAIKPIHIILNIP